MDAALHNVFSDAEVRGKLRFHVRLEKIIHVLRLPRRRDIWRHSDMEKRHLSLRVGLFNLPEDPTKCTRTFYKITKCILLVFITEVFTVIFLDSNALCQRFLFAVIQEELANVWDLLVCRDLPSAGAVLGVHTTGGKPPL